MLRKLHKSGDIFLVIALGLKNLPFDIEFNLFSKDLLFKAKSKRIHIILFMGENN